MTYIKIEQSAFNELQNLVANGFTFELTKASDGTDVIMAGKTRVNEHYYRMFDVSIQEQEEE